MLEILDIVNDTDVDITGTCLRGKVSTTYDKLVEKFGEPTYGAEDLADGKVDTEWTLSFRTITDYCDITETFVVDYITATVYNWKTGGTPYEKYDWHVGGVDGRAVELVQEALDA